MYGVTLDTVCIWRVPFVAKEGHFGFVVEQMLPS